MRNCSLGSRLDLRHARLAWPIKCAIVAIPTEGQRPTVNELTRDFNPFSKADAARGLRGCDLLLGAILLVGAESSLPYGSFSVGTTLGQ